MATRRQKKANRRNAKRSTGPRTPEGKARSSQNASKHGLFARDTVLPDENPEEFLDLIGTLEQELNAIGGFERRLVRHIADAEWRIRRIVRLESGFLTHHLEQERLRAQEIQANLSNLLALKQKSPPAAPVAQQQPPAYAAQPGSPAEAEQKNPAAEVAQEAPLAALAQKGTPTKAKQENSPTDEAQQGPPPDVAQALSLPSRHSCRLLPNPPAATNPVPHPQPTAPYQQTTQELGSTIDRYGVGPTLSTLSLYESRLNRKHQSLLKQLRLTQKNRLAEDAHPLALGFASLTRDSEVAESQPDTPEPPRETAKPEPETSEPRNELHRVDESVDHIEQAADEEPQLLTVETQHQQTPKGPDDNPTSDTRPGPQDEVASVA